MEQKRINCMKCIHYYVTWDANAPRGCKKYDFKSKDMPSVIVKMSSGQDCLAFVEKNGGKKGDRDLNDDDVW